MSESTINSICEFLHAAGSQFKIIDMGRGLRNLPEQTFLDIEYQRQAVPFPRQQHMWLGCIFWNPSLSEQQFIWFLKLPLDERGLLNQAARNMFLEKVVEALGADLGLSAEKNGELGDNPFTFTPSQTQLAHFSALAKLELKLPAPELASALAYIASPAEVDWRTLSVQSIAELTIRHASPEVYPLLSKHLEQLDGPVLKMLFEGLENCKLHRPLAITIAKQLHGFVDDYATYTDQVHLCIRALTQAPAELQSKYLEQILALPVLHVDTLILLSARWMNALAADNDTLNTFLVHLTKCEDEIFIGLYQDLVQLPKVRPVLLGLIHQKIASPVILTKLQSILES
jgi:hypothetical protein